MFPLHNLRSPIAFNHWTGLSSGHRLSCKHIGPPALILYVGVRVSLDYLNAAKATLFQTAGDEFGAEEHEVYVDLFAEKLVQVDPPFTDVGGKKKDPVGLQYPEYLAERFPHLLFREVNDRIKGYHPCYRIVFQFEVKKVSPSEWDLRVTGSCLLQYLL